MITPEQIKALGELKAHQDAIDQAVAKLEDGMSEDELERLQADLVELGRSSRWKHDLISLLPLIIRIGGMLA